MSRSASVPNGGRNLVIKRSSSRLIELLIGDLGSADAVRRESAIARLSLAGNRAVEHLAAVVRATGPHATASNRARAGALQALEAIGVPESAPVACLAIDDPDVEVAVAAAGVLGRLLGTAEGALALDKLGAVAVDSSRPETVRLAALDALSELAPDSLAPITARLQQDPSAAIRARAGGVEPDETGPAAEVRQMAAGGLDQDPFRVRALVSRGAADLPLPTLHRLVTAVRERERAEDQPGTREAWTAVRAALHHALASRGSRVALYDLRETIASSTTRLPVEFLSALGRIGDASCLDALAAAYARSGEDEWWRQHVGEAFASIVARERLTKRHQALRRALAREPALASFLGASQGS